ncbi:MAG: N-formylglutamate amidohydrolase [Bauldia sp.]|nr:N-formylglutamate amidohydrolase [Bauldia sp.]
MTVPGEFENGTAFEVLRPVRQTVPVVLNSPHSGRSYPASFLAASRLDAATIRRSEDGFVDELFRPAVAMGAPLLRALFPRAWLDVNREPFELDPRMFAGTLPPYANSRSTRVTGGLGTIPRVVADNEEIYPGPLPIADGLARIDEVYVPYHRTLRGLIDTTVESFGAALLIDCHSMPSSVRAANLRGRPDIVLGDRHSTSCSPELSDAAEGILVRLGYDVSRNRPYAGGYITEHYGRPANGVHALQIEINRALYLNERTLEKTGGFPRLLANLTVFTRMMIGAAGTLLAPRAEAAE